MKRALAALFLLAALAGAAGAVSEEPPYATTDPAISEDFRQIYRAVSDLERGDEEGYLESIVSTYASVATAGTFGDVTTVDLQPGTWDVYGTVQMTKNGATITGTCQAAVSLSSGNTTTDHVVGYNQVDMVQPDSATNASALAHLHVTVDTRTPVYLKARVQAYSAATPKALGSLWAVRTIKR